MAPGSTVSIGVEVRNSRVIDHLAKSLDKVDDKVADLDKSLPDMSSDLERVASKFKGVDTSSRDASRGVDRFGRAAGKSESKIDKLALAAGKLALAYASVETASRLLRSSFNKAVEITTFENRLKLLSDGLDDYQSVLEAAAASSRKFGLGVAEGTEGFTKAYARLRPLGFTLEEITTTFEGFQTAAKLGGASAAEAAGAWTQLVQGLGSGRLQGEELNSILDQTPLIANAIAKELGVSVGQLKKLASEGKITTDVVFNGLQRVSREGSGKLDKALQSNEQKLKDLGIAWERFQTAVGRIILPGIIAAVGKLEKGITSVVEPIERIGIAWQFVSNQLDPVIAKIQQLIGLIPQPLKQLGKFVQGSIFSSALDAVGLGAPIKAIQGVGKGINIFADQQEALNPKVKPKKETVESLSKRFGFGDEGGGSSSGGGQSKATQGAFFGRTGRLSVAPGYGILDIRNRRGDTGAVAEDAKAVIQARREMGFETWIGGDGSGDVNVTNLTGQALSNAIADGIRRHQNRVSGNTRAIDLLGLEGTPVGLPLSEVGQYGAATGFGGLSGRGNDFIHLAANSKGGGTAFEKRIEKINKMEEDARRLRMEKLEESKAELATSEQALKLQQASTELDRLALQYQYDKQSIVDEFAARNKDVTDSQTAQNLQAAELNQLEKLRLEYNQDLAGLQEEQRQLMSDMSKEAAQSPQFNPSDNLAAIPARIAELNTALMDTDSMILSLSSSIENQLASSMSNAITGLINGTTTVREAFANMLAGIGQSFIDMATRMLSQRLMMSVLGLFGGGAAPGVGGAFPLGGPAGGGLFGGGSLGVLGFAEGGDPPMGRASLVGENGPELLVPRSPSTVVPLDDADRFDRIGDLDNDPQQNEFKLETQVINGVEYATVDQVRAMGKRAAKQGQAMAYSGMRNNKSVRSRVGV